MNSPIDTLKRQILDELQAGKTFMQRSSEEFCKIYHVKLRGDYVQVNGDCYSNTITSEKIFRSDEEVLCALHAAVRWQMLEAPEGDVFQRVLTYMSWSY